MTTVADILPGTESRMELIIRFADWSRRLDSLPSNTEICRHFHVHRATAYRWRNALASARGRTS